MTATFHSWVYCFYVTMFRNLFMYCQLSATGSNGFNSCMLEAELYDVVDVACDSCSSLNIFLTQ